MKNQKKMILSSLILTILIPQIALAAWWNPVSWFNNWSFSTPEKQEVEEVKELRNEIEELKYQLENNKNVTIDSESDTEEEIDVVIETFNTSKVIEDNFSSVVSDMYLSRYKSVYSSIELLDTLSDESQRYMDGIPRNFNSFKLLVDTTFSSDSSAKGMKQVLDSLEIEEVGKFADLKSKISNYSNNLRTSSDVWISLSKEVEGRQISQLEAGDYLKDLESYFSNVSSDIDSFSNSLNLLADDYLDLKNSLMVYFEKIENNIPNVNVILPESTYVPSTINIPYFPTSIKTYCNNYGNSISCSSSSF